MYVCICTYSYNYISVPVPSFALEFVSDEHSGIGVLTNVLKQILLDQNATLTTKKSKMEVHKQCQVRISRDAKQLATLSDALDGVVSAHGGSLTNIY